jgi:hypothetical protein
MILGCSKTSWHSSIRRCAASDSIYATICASISEYLSLGSEE